jgi:glycosyltransferase involved in cell wall biosynthesis
MNILFVHEINWSTKVIYEIHELPELLSINGHDVTLIDFPERVQRQGIRRLIDLKTQIRKNAHRAYDTGSIEVRTPGRVAISPFDRLLASVTFVPLLLKTIKQKRPDVIVLYGVPTNGWQTIAIAKKKKIPVVFRALDVSHELRKSALSSLIEMAEKYVYRNADAVSANNTALAKYCVDQGATATKINTITPGMDTELFCPRERDQSLAEKYGLSPDDKTVMFMGTFFRFSGLDTFLNLFSSYLVNSPTTKVLLIGGGEQEGELRRLVEELNIEKQVIFTGFIDYGLLTDYLLLADVAINVFPSTLVTNCALPSKVLQYLCCGIPTVATPVEGLRSLIPNDHGVCYRDLNNDFVNTIIELLQDKEKLHSLSVTAREVALEKLTWNRNLKQFEDLLDEVVISGKR